MSTPPLPPYHSYAASHGTNPPVSPRHSTPPLPPFSRRQVLQMEPKHESEYVDFEPASDEEKKLTLSDAAPATGAAAALSTPADPTIGGAIPTIQLTRADIDHQVEGGNRVLIHLHDQQAPPPPPPRHAKPTKPNPPAHRLRPQRYQPYPTRPSHSVLVISHFCTPRSASSCPPKE